MQDELQKMEEVRQRLGVSYEEARYALHEAGGDVAEAVVIAEQGREAAGAGLAAAGMAFMDELKEFVAGGEIRALRLKFGNRILKDFSVSPKTAIAMLGVAVLAIAVTKLRIEVERGPEPAGELPPPEYPVE